jgi:single-stranded DNA-binding protein
VSRVVVEVETVARARVDGDGAVVIRVRVVANDRRLIRTARDGSGVNEGQGRDDSEEGGREHDGRR